jgi:YegS/Rv2252/BmrU family lipid kinase
LRAIAIVAPHVRQSHLSPFQADKSITWTDDFSSADVAVIVGGDGTVHRHLANLVDRKLPLLVVPAGSANDFASSLGIQSRRAALRAWQAFCAGAQNITTIDVGTITKRPSDNCQLTTGNWFFCCSAYLGLDSATNALANHLPRFLRAHGGYILSLLATLLRFRAQRTNVHDAKGNTLHSEPAMLTCFANTPRYGHGLRIAPQASMTDGLVDLCFVRRLGKLKLLALFSIVYWGKHTKLPYVSMDRRERFILETERPTAICADGEYVCETPAEIAIRPRALRVLVPTGTAL